MKKKKRAHIAFPLLLFLISAGLLVAANSYRYGRVQHFNIIVDGANDALMAGDTEGARTIYESVLDEDPLNSAACEGMMQLAYESGDRALLMDYYDRWLDIQVETGNTSDERIDIMGGIINDMERRTDLNSISALIADGDYQAAQGALQELAASGKNEEADKAQADVLRYLASKDMKLRNFDRAVGFLEKAVTLSHDDPATVALYRDAQEWRLKAALDAHDTAAATDIAALADLTSYADAIEAEKKRAEHLSSVRDTIKAAFDAGDTDALYEQLNDEELKADAAELKKPFIIQGQVSGAGSIAFYSIDDRLYVYYGNMKDGYREGDGRWAHIASDGRLVIYSLNWKADKPEGEGMCDRYSAPSDSEEAEAQHEHDEFTTHGGVMDGKYSMKNEIITEWPYDYSVEYELKNGYCPRIEPGEYPDLIDLYNTYPAPLAGWTEAEVYDPAWKKEYTTTIWFNWTPARWVVDGIEADIAPANNT